MSLLNANDVSASGNYSPETSFARSDLSNSRAQDIAGQVKKAFNEVRIGSYSSANDLIKLGDQVFPFIEPYLTDENAAVRSEVVNIALSVRGEKTLPLIAKALANSSAETRIRTADRLYLQYRFAVKHQPLGDFSKYKDFLPEKIAAHPAIGENLRKNLKSGNISTQSVFLLANFPGKESEDILKLLSIEMNSPETRKLSSGAMITLSKLGNKEATIQLSKVAAENDYDSLKFLLENIYEIESMEILSPLSRTLADKSYITRGNARGKIHEKLPNGIWVDYPVARRLCDLAVNSFVERFNLKVSFGLHSTVYSENQISEVRRNLSDLNVK